ncbi:MAG: hypothetical protein DMD91_21175 [Candidatus Rokuibacteriota bacterium]|nr:MAG: hypothetical protein DMD91_21175 [Candidatus Rokubacteria bacterium]
MTDEWSEIGDDALGRRLHEELPRYAAPPGLRGAILAQRPRRGRPAAWFAPTVSALATAMVLVLVGLTWLPRTMSGDVVQRIVNGVVLEHTRVMMWGARRPEIVPAALAQDSGIRLAKVFVGDDVLSLEASEPVYIDWRHGVALHYRDQDGHRITYVALPAPRMPMPDRQRVQVDRYKPALMRVGGFATLVWKHGDVACFLVSDMVSASDLERFKEYFVRVRVATEPFLLY